MKKLMLFLLFANSFLHVKSQSLNLNGDAIYGDTIYIKKGSFNQVTFNVPLPSKGVLQYQWLMNGHEYVCNGQTGLAYINEKGRYRARIIWYHDGTAEIYFSTKLYVKYGKPGF